MEELVAIEYLEGDWASARELASRVEEVADAAVEARLASVDLPGLLSGSVDTPSWAENPAVLFGLRAKTVDTVVAFGAALSLRGFTGVYTWCAGAEEMASRSELESMLLGLGLVRARGGRRRVYDRSPAQIRDALEEANSVQTVVGPQIWMPAPDRFGRAVDGLFLEEADRRGVDWIWAPGSGVNRGSTVEDGARGPRVVEARRDDGRLQPEALARWATGDRLERGKIRLSDVTDTPRRWLRELTGWERR